MGRVQYTAKRSLAQGHDAETIYTMDLDFVDLGEDESVVRTEERATGGGAAVTFQRIDRLFSFQTGPVRDFWLELLREFLDSTESGEAFRVWPYGDEAEPLILKRIEDSHEESAFLRAGGADLDWFQATFVGVESREAEAINIYSPNVGGPFGGLGEAPARGGAVQFVSANIPDGIGGANGGSVNGLSTFDWPSLNSGTGGFGIGGVLSSGDLASYTALSVMSRPGTGTKLIVRLRVPTADLRSSAQTAYFTDVTVTDTDDSFVCATTRTSAAVTTFTTDVDGAYTILEWQWEDVSGIYTLTPTHNHLAQFN